MDRYGLIGYPLGHSFSQKYFTEKFSEEGTDARYDLFAIESIDLLPKLLEETKGLKGFNVTIPSLMDSFFSASIPISSHVVALKNCAQ